MFVVQSLAVTTIQESLQFHNTKTPHKPRYRLLISIHTALILHLQVHLLALLLGDALNSTSKIGHFSKIIVLPTPLDQDGVDRFHGHHHELHSLLTLNHLSSPLQIHPLHLPISTEYLLAPAP